jgi:hypothetical protein
MSSSILASSYSPPRAIVAYTHSSSLSYAISLANFLFIALILRVSLLFYSASIDYSSSSLESLLSNNSSTLSSTTTSSSRVIDLLFFSREEIGGFWGCYIGNILVGPTSDLLVRLRISLECTTFFRPMLPYYYGSGTRGLMPRDLARLA